MNKNKCAYRAYVINSQGASDDAGSSHNLTALKKQIRATFGPGWTVVINKIEHDGEGGWFQPEEIERFTLRK